MDLAITVKCFHNPDSVLEYHGMGPFFRPMTVQDLQRHPIDMGDERIAQNIKSAERSIDEDGPYDEYPWDLAGRIEVVCSHLSHLTLYARKPDGLSLEEISGWKHEYTPPVTSR